MAIKFNSMNINAGSPVTRAHESTKHLSFGEKVVVGEDRPLKIPTREEIAQKYNQRRVNLAHLADLLNMDNYEYDREMKKIEKAEARELAIFKLR